MMLPHFKYNSIGSLRTDHINCQLSPVSSQSQSQIRACMKQHYWETLVLVTVVGKYAVQLVPRPSCYCQPVVPDNCLTAPSFHMLCYLTIKAVLLQDLRRRQESRESRQMPSSKINGLLGLVIESRAVCSIKDSLHCCHYFSWWPGSRKCNFLGLIWEQVTLCQSTINKHMQNMYSG